MQNIKEYIQDGIRHDSCSGYFGEQVLKMVDEAMRHITKEALSKAVSVIYFNDNSNYESALWEIVSILGGEEAADMLESDESAAYQKYCEGVV